MNAWQHVIAFADALCAHRQLSPTESQIVETAVTMTTAPNRRWRYTKKEDDLLIRADRNGDTARSIAQQIGRPLHSVRARLYRVRKDHGAL